MSSSSSCLARTAPLRHDARLRSRRPAAFQPVCLLPRLFGGSLKVGKTVLELRKAVQDTDRGLKTTPAQKAEILKLVSVLEDAGKGQNNTSTDVSATWRLLWTTEKETLFIIKNAGWFGTKAGEVFQVIDVEGQRLNNVICFPPEGVFMVDSSLKRAGDKRLEFKFTKAVIKTPKRSIQLPPYGKGWFDTVYLDKDIRVAKDIRGDTLVVARDGPPRSFA